MTYIVFIESEILSVPHMEPLAAVARDAALQEARDIMATHRSAIVANVFDGDGECIASLSPRPGSAAV